MEKMTQPDPSAKGRLTFSHPVRVVRTCPKFAKLLFTLLLPFCFVDIAAAAPAPRTCEGLLPDGLSIASTFNRQWAAQDFDLYVTLPEGAGAKPLWVRFVNSLRDGNTFEIAAGFKELPASEQSLALTTLLVAQDHGLQVPESLRIEIDVARVERSKLRNYEIPFKGELSIGLQKSLTYSLVLVGIRRSKIERVIERAREFLGLKSRDLVPLIQPKRAENSLGD